MRWSSIDFEANSITIEHTITIARIDGKRIVVADDTTKSKSSFRTLPLVPAIRTKLLAVREEQEQNRKLCRKSYNKADSDYIYTDALGNRISPDYLTLAFPKFLEKNGFQRMRFHDLRHSCASLLLANGVPLKEIQVWLGHSDFAVTANVYAHLEFDSKIKSAEKMTWLGDTSLGKEAPTVETPTPDNAMQALPEFMQSLFASGVPSEVVQAWLKQTDFTSVQDLVANFQHFQSSVVG